jgi:hypothetical protein
MLVSVRRYCNQSVPTSATEFHIFQDKINTRTGEAMGNIREMDERLLELDHL